MTTCPVCRDGTMGRIGSAPSLRVRDYIMVLSRSPRGRLLVKVEITGFKHSGIKLRNNGHFTFRYPNGHEETRHSDDGLYHCCPKCGGAREIDPTPRDTALLTSDIRFLVSGKGIIRAAEILDGVWYTFLVPRISTADLLTREDQVFHPQEVAVVDGCYQRFMLKLAGDTNVEDHTPGFCDEHGWYEEPSCPDCTGGA